MALEISQVERVLDISGFDVDAEINKVKAEWSEFLSKMPDVPEAHRYYSVLAWYTTWSSFVRANDTYHYDAMLMSKNHMSSVWSWDHCFNALIWSYVDPRAAVEQLLLPFEVQSESGAIPDMWNPNNELVWGVTKPPIHGWCFGKLMDRHEYSKEMYEKVYNHLRLWTDWWMTYRDFDHDGIPAYPQPCDSGWDGSSLFEIGYYLESPDLSAFLVLQMNTLARIALKLDRHEEALVWEKRADELLANLYNHSWENDRFVAKLSNTHEYDPNPRSSLALMPIILGSLLDKDKADRLAELLDEDYIGEYGISGGVEFDDDGNKIKGSIWASQVYLFTEGLSGCGHRDKALKAAKGFVNMIETKVTSHYEGFDADGRSIGVPGYTWTSSVYLLYVWEYLS